MEGGGEYEAIRWINMTLIDVNKNPKLRMILKRSRAISHTKMDFGKVQCREGSSNRWIQFDFVQDRCFFSGKMAAVEESVGDSNVRWPMCIMRNDQYTVD